MKTEQQHALLIVLTRSSSETRRASSSMSRLTQTCGICSKKLQAGSLGNMGGKAGSRDGVLPSKLETGAKCGVITPKRRNHSRTGEKDSSGSALPLSWK